MNWMDRLQQFRDENPDLPQGPSDAEVEAALAPEAPVQKKRLDIILERKGRKGKTVTLVRGWDIPAAEVQSVCAELKKKLGTGGAVEHEAIMVQGDRRTDLLDRLTAMGYKARII